MTETVKLWLDNLNSKKSPQEKAWNWSLNELEILMGKLTR